MLCIRDPADETNDLGRKGIAIKHVQATFRRLSNNLDRDLISNTRYSLLGPLVGTSYILNKERRQKLRDYGYKVLPQMQHKLAATAKMVVQREEEAEANKESKEDKEKADLAREKRDREMSHLAELRNAKLRQEAERMAVLEHGEAMASILDMPSVEAEADEQNSNDLKGPRALQTEGEEANLETQAEPITHSPAEQADVPVKQDR